MGKYWKTLENMENVNPPNLFTFSSLAEAPWMWGPHRCCRWIASTPTPSCDSAAVEGWPLWGGQAGQSPGGVKAQGLGRGFGT